MGVWADGRVGIRVKARAGAAISGRCDAAHFGAAGEEGARFASSFAASSLGQPVPIWRNDASTDLWRRIPGFSKNTDMHSSPSPFCWSGRPPPGFVLTGSMSGTLELPF